MSGIPIDAWTVFGSDSPYPRRELPGKPVKVYHGTKKGWGRAGVPVGPATTRGHDQYGPGLYFTDNPETAKYYAGGGAAVFEDAAVYSGTIDETAKIFDLDTDAVPSSVRGVLGEDVPEDVTGKRLFEMAGEDKDLKARISQGFKDEGYTHLGIDKGEIVPGTPERHFVDLNPAGKVYEPLDSSTLKPLPGKPTIETLDPTNPTGEVPFRLSPTDPTNPTGINDPTNPFGHGRPAKPMPPQTPAKPPRASGGWDPLDEIYQEPQWGVRQTSQEALDALNAAPKVTIPKVSQATIDANLPPAVRVSRPVTAATEDVAASATSPSARKMATEASSVLEGIPHKGKIGIAAGAIAAVGLIAHFAGKKKNNDQAQAQAVVEGDFGATTQTAAPSMSNVSLGDQRRRVSSRAQNNLNAQRASSFLYSGTSSARNGLAVRTRQF